MRSKNLLAVMVAVSLFVLSAWGAYLLLSFAKQERGYYLPETSRPPEKKQPVLADYPKIFEKETVIVVKNEASGREEEVAKMVAGDLEKFSGQKVEIISEKDIGNYKNRYNIIAAGTLADNPLLQEVCNLTGCDLLTVGDSSKDKGYLAIFRNPWNERLSLLIISGTTETGLEQAVKLLSDQEALHSTLFSFIAQALVGPYITLTGQIYVAGNEPFPLLAIDAKETKYFLTGQEAQEDSDLWQLQREYVTIEGFSVEALYHPKAGMLRWVVVRSFKKL